MKLRKRKRGLTMVELLLVASIMTILALSLYNAIANGIKVWDRTHKFVVEEDIALFLDELADDLHNSANLKSLLFYGRKNSISFPAVIQVRVDPYLDPMQTKYTHQIGRVRYYFDSAHRDLFRQEANYGLALENKFFPERRLVHSLKNVEFFYFTVKEDNLVETPEVQEWPSMVKIVVHYEGSRGQESVIEKSVILPMYSTGNV